MSRERGGTWRGGGSEMVEEYLTGLRKVTCFKCFDDDYGGL